MFSVSDIQGLTQSLPPQKALAHDETQLPPLLRSTSGQGLVTTSHARTAFERIATTSDESRIALRALSRTVGVQDNAISQLAKLSSLVLLDKNSQHIIPKKQKDAEQQRLRELLAAGPVSKTAFSSQNDVSLESLNTMIISQFGNEIISEDDHVILESYQQLVLDSIKQHLNEALVNASAAELSSVSTTGTPPTWYISRCVRQVMKEQDISDRFHVSETQDMISCIPKASVVSKRDAELIKLQEGDLAYIDLNQHFEKYREIYHSFEDVQRELSRISDTHQSGPCVISIAWIKSFGNSCIEALKILGYADLIPVVQNTFPECLHAEVFERLESHASDDVDGLHSVKHFLLTNQRFDADREILVHSAEAHAAHQWERLKDNQDSVLKMQISEMIQFIPEDQGVLQALSEDQAIHKAMEDAFWGRIAELETVNEIEFGKYWGERVAGRIANYTAGLNALEDVKLQEQLTELLTSHLAKELVPETITKASRKGLLRSRKTKRNVQRLENSLKKKEGVLSTVERLNKRVLEPRFEGQSTSGEQTPSMDQKDTYEDMGNAESAKATESGLVASSQSSTKIFLIDDMVRRMQKQNDGPTLFLSLVIVLIGRNFPGLVYATGKFAPRLMKQLKTRLSEEQYTQLGKWKDLTKTATLTAEDKEEMKRMASQQD